MSAPKFTYANGREAKAGDTAVNKVTGKKIVLTRNNLHSGFVHLLKHYVHESDRPAMPRSERARLVRDFQ